MKYKSLFTALILFSVMVMYGQDKKAGKFARTITPEDLKERLAVLASDSLEGRETGEPGQKKAAAYIAGKFEEFGLTPPVDTRNGKSYYQSFPLKRVSYHTVYLKKDGEKKENLEDFLYYSRVETLGEEYIEVVYAGDIEDPSLEGLDVEGKFVAFSGSDMSGWRGNLRSLEDQEVAGYIMLLEDEEQLNFAIDRFSKYLTKSRIQVEVSNTGTKTIAGNKQLAQWLFERPYDELKEKGRGATCKLILNADMHIENILAENVLGYLKGSEKPEELLVITAHYDHLGVIDGEIYNGADDDGSGTTTVLELAEAFATAAKKGNRPERSVLFMTVSGEEKGLLGSKYYTEHPVFPLENTITNLNIDMVGRVDSKHEENPYYVYLIGSDKLSQDLHQLSEKVNEQTTRLELDYTYNADDDPNRFYYRSDHYNFAKNNIPVIFYFNGTHPDYHKPTDTIEKIHFDKMDKIAELIFYTAWKIANREEKIQLD